MAAAVSTFTTSLIGFFLSDRRKIPDQFVEAAKNEVDTLGYYRDKQEVHIEFREQDDLDVITISFTSRLIPVKDRIFVEYPKIDPPEEFRKSAAFGQSVEYRINHNAVSEVEHTTVDCPTDDSLIVHYTMSKNNKYSDNHIWISPVLYYDVYFKVPQGFDCHLHEWMGDRPLGLTRVGGLNSGHVHFFHRHAAFTRQGFTWTISRRTAGNRLVGTPINS
jgi:hypothetical protein